MFANLKLLRVTILIQLLVSIWFFFSPDLIPEVFRIAEMENDRKLYEILDKIVVALIVIQNLLCVALWWPTRLISWLYFIVFSLIVLIGTFSGPSVLSSIDGLLGTFQALATGAMLTLLYTNQVFHKGQRDKTD